MSIEFDVPKNPEKYLGLLYEVTERMGRRIIGRIDAEAYNVRWNAASDEFEISAFIGRDNVQILHADEVCWQDNSD